jgi:WD40 repeat protein
VTAGFDLVTRVWNDHRLIAALKGTTPPTTAALSPNGTFAASGYPDGTVVVWRVSTRAPVADLVEAASISMVRISPNGKLILTVDENGGARIYRCDVCTSDDNLQTLARARLNRTRPPAASVRVR